MLKNKNNLHQMKKVIPWLLLFGIAFFIYFGEKLQPSDELKIEAFSDNEIKNTEQAEANKRIDEDADKNTNMDEISSIEEQTKFLFIDVSGAVHNPMVVKVPEGSRVFEAIDLAGGIMENADTKYLNLAQTLTDGEKIYVQTKEEASSEAVVDSPITNHKFEAANENKVNLNQADSMELQKLKGVGPSTAERILEYRREYGSFKSIEELKNVKGIGEKTFEKLKNNLYID
ncbi:MAG: helix-hairpin-helix domain-containing protein [Anaerovorax sp.]|nr:helix-hairpin-helix domain-containing protein [Anaerovorax sp.]